MTVHAKHGGSPLELLAFAAIAVALGLLGGMLVTAGRVDLTLVTVVGIAGLVGLFRPGLSVIAITAAALLVVGTVQLYFPQFQKIQWGVALGAGLLGTVATLGFLFTPQKKTLLPPNSAILFLFMLLICASALINSQSIGLFAFGFKGYVQVLGIFFAIAMLNTGNAAVDTLPRLLIFAAIVQLPFVLHQWLFLVPRRLDVGEGIVAEDVVAGTMGASAMGGGSNAVLSILLISSIAVMAAGYRNGRITGLKATIGSILCTIPIFLNANRIAILYLVMVFVVIFAPTMFREMSRFLAGACLAAIFVIGSVWTNLHFGSRSDDFTDWQDLVRTTIERNTQPEIGYGGFDLNRLGSITFWWQEQFEHGNLSTFLFGHGPGAAREAAGSALPVVTLAGSRYPEVGIGLTGVSSILWELGVVGLAVVFAMFASAFRSARFLTRNLKDQPVRQYVAEGLQVSILIFAVSMVHKNTFVFHLTYQALLYMILGVLAAWHYQVLIEQRNRQTGIEREKLGNHVVS